LAWNVPSRPVRPCTITRVFLSTKIAIENLDPSLAEPVLTQPMRTTQLFPRPRQLFPLPPSSHPPQ
jgi:hypothetical protein